MKPFCKVACIVFLFLFTGRALAQETMMANVNEAYLAKLIDAAKNNHPRGKAYDIKVHMADLVVAGRVADVPRKSSSDRVWRHADGAQCVSHFLVRVLSTHHHSHHPPRKK